MNHRPDSTDRFMPLAAGLITGLAAAAGVLLARRAAPSRASAKDIPRGTTRSISPRASCSRSIRSPR